VIDLACVMLPACHLANIRITQLTIYMQ